MSVETSKPVETAVVDTTKALPEQPESSTAPAETSVAPVEATASAPAVAADTEETAVPTTEEVKKDETPTTLVPASEGVLGYKEPTLFKYVCCANDSSG